MSGSYTMSGLRHGVQARHSGEASGRSTVPKPIEAGGALLTLITGKNAVSVLKGINLSYLQIVVVPALFGSNAYFLA